MYVHIFPKQRQHVKVGVLNSALSNSPEIQDCSSSAYVPKPSCLSPAANSLNSRIAGRQVPKPRCLSPAATQAQLPIAWISGLLVARCLSLGA